MLVMSSKGHNFSLLESFKFISVVTVQETLSILSRKQQQFIFQVVIIWVIAFRQQIEKPKFTGQGKYKLQNTE